jgi:hypothetical protein
MTVVYAANKDWIRFSASINMSFTSPLVSGSVHRLQDLAISSDWAVTDMSSPKGLSDKL